MAKKRGPGGPRGPKARKGGEFVLAVREADHRTDRLKVIAVVLAILAATAPLAVVRLMVQDLAGETTEVSLTLATTISIGVSLTLVGVDGVLMWKMRRQGAELVRLRNEKAILEARLHERQGGTA